MSIERQNSGGDPAQLRVSDDDRHKVAEILREAAGEGRIDLDELDERLEATYAAKTYADLVPITVDLPAHEQQPAGAAARGAARDHDPQLLDGGDGRVHAPGRLAGPRPPHGVRADGQRTLDLRTATFAERDITITANAIMGEVR